MHDRINEIKTKFESLLATLNTITVSEELLVEMENVLEKLTKETADKYFEVKLKSDEWPLAADPMLICNDSVEDRKARASAIYSLFVSNHVKKPGQLPKKMLDYGCGEGYLVKKAVDERVDCVGYDIKEQGWEGKGCFLTTDRQKIGECGPYDVIILYDVLDHVVDVEPVEVLKDAKSLLAPSGVIVLRVHPWSSRHGTHLWKLNKAYAHLIFTDEELEKMGHKGIPTYKVTSPRETYPRWIREAELKIVWENLIYEQAGYILEHNPPLKARVVSHFKEGGGFGYHDIEEVFRDYVLTRA